MAERRAKFDSQKGTWIVEHNDNRKPKNRKSSKSESTKPEIFYTPHEYFSELLISAKDRAIDCLVAAARTQSHYAAYLKRVGLSCDNVSKVVTAGRLRTEHMNGGVVFAEMLHLCKIIGEDFDAARVTASSRVSKFLEIYQRASRIIGIEGSYQIVKRMHLESKVEAPWCQAAWQYFIDALRESGTVGEQLVLLLTSDAVSTRAKVVR